MGRGGEVGVVDSGKQAMPNGYDSWSDYWKTQEMPWRTEPEIDAERQRYLAERRAVRPVIKQGIYPFRDENGRIVLTRADIEWLLATHDSGGMHGPVNWTDEKQRGRKGLDVRGANLSEVDLQGLPLAGLHGSLTFTELDAFDEDTDLVDAAAVDLSHANLRGAQLQRATLRRVHLEDADLRFAQLTRAELYNAFLSGARLGQSHLAGASLRRAVLSADTSLYRVDLSDDTSRAARLRDIRWNGADVTGIEWTRVAMLGDEQVIRTRHRPRPYDYPNATRANRQLATMLRSQGLAEDADRFAYRALVCQRQLLRLQRQWGRWALQTLLAVLAGYGYRLWRIFVAYALIVGLFTAAFLASDVLSGQATWTVPHVLDALQISLNAIHGRVFFAQFHLDTLQSWLATVESILGILIEGVFVAMLVQRFFGGR